MDEQNISTVDSDQIHDMFLLIGQLSFENRVLRSSLERAQIELVKLRESAVKES